MVGARSLLALQIAHLLHSTPTADFLKMYTQYLSGYSKSLEVIHENRNNKKFQAFLSAKRKECGLDLMSYLIVRACFDLPSTDLRSLLADACATVTCSLCALSAMLFLAVLCLHCSVPRYELLLRELRRYTTPVHPEYAKLAEAFDKIQHIASHINEETRQVRTGCAALLVRSTRSRCARCGNGRWRTCRSCSRCRTGSRATSTR